MRDVRQLMRQQCPATTGGGTVFASAKYQVRPKCEGTRTHALGRHVGNRSFMDADIGEVAT
jgi:hypothetical protein